MHYHKITIELYYKQEAWGDRSGLEIRIEDNDNERGSWVTEEDLAKDFERAQTMAQIIAKDLKILRGYKDSDSSRDGKTLYIYDWYSIGD